MIFYILKELLNGRISNPDIATWLLWAFAAIVISAVMLFVSGMAAHIAAFNILYGLRCKITAKLGRLPVGYLGRRSSGALRKIVADDVELKLPEKRGRYAQYWHTQQTTRGWKICARAHQAE